MILFDVFAVLHVTQSLIAFCACPGPAISLLSFVIHYTFCARAYCNHNIPLIPVLDVYSPYQGRPPLSSLYLKSCSACWVQLNLLLMMVLGTTPSWWLPDPLKYSGALVTKPTRQAHDYTSHGLEHCCSTIHGVQMVSQTYDSQRAKITFLLRAPAPIVSNLIIIQAPW